MEIIFFKYQGTGNDFVIIDNRDNSVSLSEKQIKKICDRKFGIGADGLMLLENETGYDFKMVYFNSDGNQSSMCGNGGRCLTKFALHRGITKSVYNFIAIDGEHESEIDSDEIVRLKMKDVDQVEVNANRAILNTGSPHFISFSKNVGEIDVYAEGHAIRYSKEFAQEGINVNFAESTGSDSILVRTYERGVENETLSCGTGVTAAALVFAHNDNGFNRVKVSTPGGNLYVEFDKMDDTHFQNIWLCGPAEFVFKGEIEI